MSGERLGNWMVEDEIGRDDMGRLFRARPVEDSSRQVRLKKLTHPKSQTAGFARLFLAQVELLRKLRHPSILAVLDGGEHSGVLYYVTEEPGGPDYQSLLNAFEKPTWPQALAIAMQIVPAIRHAHRRSVLHRDLKPANLFRCADGSAKLAGFGVTKFFGDNLIGSAVELVSAAAYLSPEQAAGKPQTKRSDFYSLGCMLYALVVGRPPFTGNTVVELSHKHCYALPERPIHFVRDLPEEFDAFLMKLLAKEPTQRPGSGTQLIQELEGIWVVQERLGRVGKRPQTIDPPDDRDEVEKEVIEPRLPELPPKPPVPWIRRWYVVLPAFLVTAGILVWAFAFRGPGPDELMTGARPLLESDKPADWDKAWQEYLEPLSRKYPDKYKEEVAEARRKIDRQGELRRALVAGANVRYSGEAERFYNEGLRLVQAGQYAAARKVWESLVTVYTPIEAERRWVGRAAEGLERLRTQEASRTGAAGAERWRESLRPVLEEIRRAPPARAEAMVQSLLLLYRDDPDVASLRELLIPNRK